MTASSNRKTAAIERAQALLPVIADIAHLSLDDIGKELTRRGVPGAWHATSVQRLLNRIDGIVHGVSLRVGDARDLTNIPFGSLDAVITSPPYADQMKRHYVGIKEKDYAAFTVGWMSAVEPLMKPHGSIAFPIRAHVKNRNVTEYVEETIRAVRAAGWYRPGELMWIKKSSMSKGSLLLQRPSFEHILWFSRSKFAYRDPRGNGVPSDRVGSDPVDSLSDAKNSTAGHRSGIARGRDYVVTGSGDRGPNSHPAAYPVAVPEWLIRLLVRPGGMVLDPFVGSGSTAIAARQVGCRCIGSDLRLDYLIGAAARLARTKK